jgi:hypothetical protein
LTKFIEKSINVYSIKYVYYKKYLMINLMVLISYHKYM